ncbi:hypothetical protein A2U01_0104086, partial [Trifolium medium]|nr:hypothetical protein [Trifolium medium]
VPLEEDYARFHFHWNKWHFLIEPKKFTYKRTDLSPDDVATTTSWWLSWGLSRPTF